MSAERPLWSGRSVLVTGHTGFKGAWLSLWLHRLGAEVHGFALGPPTNPNLFEVLQLGSSLASDTRADLADLTMLQAVFTSTRPSVVFHLAAQPLVRESYRQPRETFATNVMGTANVLEAVRKCDSVRAVTLITTDKVYENRDGAYPYRECDALGGHDPYSASKAAAEMLAASYRASFFGGHPGHHPARIATARAGNVIGGGDWASDRLIPDCVRAFTTGEPVVLRNPDAVRPWQHVLEPLAGYLQLAERLLGPDGGQFATAWNFGPNDDGHVTVREVADLAAHTWGGTARAVVAPDPGDPHEAAWLRLDTTRAHVELGWGPRWSLRQALEHTLAWYRARDRGAEMVGVSLDQIAHYEQGGEA